MAFYSSRVDDNGNELERRLTGRSQKSTGSSSVPRLSASSRSSDAQAERIRYINPAAFIETTDYSDSSLNDCESNFEPEPNPGQIVPPLDIESNEGANSHRYYTFSYRKHCEPATVVDPQVAYNTWLSAKRKVKSDEAARRKKIEEAKKEAEEERKRQAEAEYHKWLKKKDASQQNQLMKPMPPNAHLPSQGSRTQSQTSTKPSTTQRFLSECEAKARREAWERKKRLEDEKKRLEKQMEEERKRKEEEQRRKRGEDAWKKWNLTAASKPKPVPLNQGFFTLRGTVSNIFVNPNEWQS